MGNGGRRRNDVGSKRVLRDRSPKALTSIACRARAALASAALASSRPLAERARPRDGWRFGSGGADLGRPGGRSHGSYGVAASPRTVPRPRAPPPCRVLVPVTAQRSPKSRSARDPAPDRADRSGAPLYATARHGVLTNITASASRVRASSLRRARTLSRPERVTSTSRRAPSASAASPRRSRGPWRSTRAESSTPRRLPAERARRCSQRRRFLLRPQGGEQTIVSTVQLPSASALQPPSVHSGGPRQLHVCGSTTHAGSRSWQTPATTKPAQ